MFSAGILFLPEIYILNSVLCAYSCDKLRIY